MLGLSCDTWDLCCILLDHSLQPMGFSLIVTHGFNCRVLVPLPRIEPVSPELKSGLLTAGPQGKSLKWGLEQNVLNKKSIKSSTKRSFKQVTLDEQKLSK